MNDIESILKRIQSTGYWDVRIRPSRFKADLIDDIAECERIMAECFVELRGWRYPWFHTPDVRRADDFIYSTVDFEGHVEFWRFFQSGQFLHQFACWEDYVPQELRGGARTPSGVDPTGRYLDPTETVYRLTEIYEFAARLAKKGLFPEGMEISIRLCGMRGRQLHFLEPSRHLSMVYLSASEEFALPPHALSEADLLASAHDLALKDAYWILQRFHWKGIGRGIFAEEQAKFLQRRVAI